MTLDDLLTKHPTPWTAEPCGVTGCECRMINDSNGQMIIEVGFDLDANGPIVAPMFAAAPEMLGILQMLARGNMIDKAIESRGAIKQRIRDVIAKARGASHE